MQSTTGTDLVANSADTGQITVHKVWFDWDNDTSYTDESARLLRWSVSEDLSDPQQSKGASGAGQFTVGSVTLANESGRYSPTNTGSPIYGDISANGGWGVPVKIEAGYYDSVGGNEVLIQFEGYVERVDIITPSSPEATFSLIGGERRTLENKNGTALYTDKYAPVYLTALATNSGITSTDFDEGMFRIPYLWKNENDDDWREAQAIASAELGYVYTANGEWRFENAWHWLTDSDHAASVLTLDESGYISLSPSWPMNEVYNVFQVPYKPRSIGARALLFTLNELWEIGPGVSDKEFTATFQHPVAYIEEPGVNVDYVITDADGNDLSDDITITYTKRAQAIELSVSNANATYAAQFRKLEIYGNPVTAGGDGGFVELTATDSAIGNPEATGIIKRYVYPSSVYVQTIQQAAFICAVLRDRMKNPRMVVVANLPALYPYLELGDRVTLQSSADGLDEDFYITNIQRNGDGPGLGMTLTCLQAAGYYGYTAAEYFVLGTDDFGDSKRLFY